MGFNDKTKTIEIEMMILLPKHEEMAIMNHKPVSVSVSRLNKPMLKYRLPSPFNDTFFSQ